MGRDVWVARVCLQAFGRAFLDLFLDQGFLVIEFTLLRPQCSRKP